MPTIQQRSSTRLSFQRTRIREVDGVPDVSSGSVTSSTCIPQLRVERAGSYNPFWRELRYFIAGRTSMIITVGVSGRWDPYLLELLFRWVLQCRIPLVNVRPSSNSGFDTFVRFRERFFPNVPQAFATDLGFYWPWPSTADNFMVATFPEYFLDKPSTGQQILPMIG